MPRTGAPSPFSEQHSAARIMNLRPDILKSFALAAVIGAVALPLGAQDGDQTLADIRQELTVLYVEIQNLKRELSTTGTPSNLSLQGTSALDRVDAMEAELKRLTAATEELTNRVNWIVEDGTNRIGDLEFRLVELEGGDISALGETTTLGGDLAAPTPAAAPVPEAPGPELAVGERAEFDQALDAFNSGAYDAAEKQFASFAETYTGGPLTTEAHYWRGKSLAALGNVSGAARAYLESFSGDPESGIAPKALYELGLSLDVLGQKDEACLMLVEVTTRFPADAVAGEALAAKADMGCV